MAVTHLRKSFGNWKYNVGRKLQKMALPSIVYHYEKGKMATFYAHTAKYISHLKGV